jgi:DNA mismatch endonuclease (patch repair protein)
VLPIPVEPAMVDHLTAQQRSRQMSRIKGKDTAPEWAVRRTLHALGIGYRLHRKDLPGTPDIVISRSRAAIFVHGCYWHRHRGCKRTTTPSTRREFWEDKFATNVARDARKKVALEAAGWRVLTVWECETKAKDRVRLRARMIRELDLASRLETK